MRSWLIPLLLLVGSLLALVAAPYLALGRDDQAAERRLNHDRVYNLSQLKREQLDRNYEYFQNNLTDGERQKIRELHAALQQDKSGLKEVMQDYHVWLLSLNAQQRDDLFQTPDPEKRIALMKSIVGRRPVVNVARWFGVQFTWQGQPLSPAALDRVMIALEEQVKLALQQSPGQADSLARLQQESRTKLHRNLKVIEAIRNLPESSAAPLFEPGQRGGEFNPQPLLLRRSPPALVDAVAERIKEFSLAPEIEQFIVAEEQGRGVRLLQVLFPSLIAQRYALRQEVQNSAHPTSAALRQLFDEIPDQNQKDALLALDAADFQAELRTRYLDKSRQIDLPREDEISRLFIGGMAGNRRRGGRGFPEQRGGGGRGDSGRSDDRDGPGRGGRGGDFPGERGGPGFGAFPLPPGTGGGNVNPPAPDSSPNGGGR